MKGIGGKTKLTIQVKTVTANAICEQVAAWKDAQTLTGWLDLLDGAAGHTTYAAKIQESTHVFVADYAPLAAGVEAETTRAIIDGKAYDVTLIDNPMEMGSGSQLEIYLKFTGGQ